MEKDAPPSAAERSQLMAARKHNLPRPGPSLQPHGLGASAARYKAQERAVTRERRIQSIDVALTKESGRAKSGFTSATRRALPKPAPAKTKSPTQGKSRGTASRAFARSR